MTIQSSHVGSGIKGAGHTHLNAWPGAASSTRSAAKPSETTPALAQTAWRWARRWNSQTTTGAAVSPNSTDVTTARLTAIYAALSNKHFKSNQPIKGEYSMATTPLSKEAKNAGADNELILAVKAAAS
jgi:hypothetical protein